MEGDFDPKTRTAAQQPRVTRHGEDFLVVIYAPQQADLGRRYVLNQPVTSIGRGRDNDIVLPSDCISRRHLNIERHDGAVFVVDQTSTNGTFINDDPRRVAERRLARGDQIKIGDTIFKYLSGSDVEAQYHEVIFRMTVTDGLTNLSNRKQLDQRLDEEIPRASRHGRDLSLLMLDIDHFKRINDTHGHVAGDSVLRGLAALLQRRLRPQDSLGRYGGEEFCAILPETTLPKARGIAEELRASVETHAFAAESVREIQVTISIGAAQFKPGMRSADLYKAADEMLYGAKRGGRNKVCC